MGERFHVSVVIRERFYLQKLTWNHSECIDSVLLKLDSLESTVCFKYCNYQSLVHWPLDAHAGYTFVDVANCNMANVFSTKKQFMKFSPAKLYGMPTPLRLGLL